MKADGATAQAVLNPLPPRLEEEGPAVLQELRASLWTVICAIPGGIRTSADLHKTLQIDPMLAWGVHKAATSDKPFAASVVLPGAAALSKFLAASKKKGVPSELCERASAAIDVFEELVERHAGDRSTFESMAADLSGEHTDAADLKSKRAAFRANGHIWGMQAKTLLSATIVHPGKPGWIDAASIRGQIGLRQCRSRANLRTEFKWKLFPTDPSAERIHSTREPIDPKGSNIDGIALMNDFCSQPLPEFSVKEHSSGFKGADLLMRGLGNSSAVTWFVGTVTRNFNEVPLVTPPGRWFAAQILKPAEVFTWDLLIHEDLLTQNIQPTVKVFGSLRGGDSVMEQDEGDLLPVQAKLVDLGVGMTAAVNADYPRYPELIEHATSCLRWQAQKLRIFRVRIDYPVLHSLVKIGFDLP